MTSPTEAKALVGIYFQVSRKYRSLARLPEGMTGREAMVNADPRGRWSDEKLYTEEDCADQFLRCYTKPSDRIELSPSAFASYLRAGGGTVR
jgi:hypothetical protein